MVELTVAMNSLSKYSPAKERKQQKQPYDSLFSDILAAGKLSSITYSTLEIGTLGDYFPTDAHHSMELLFPEQHSKWHRDFLDHSSKIAAIVHTFSTAEDFQCGLARTYISPISFVHK